MSDDLLRNPKDPLRNTGPEVRHELLRRFGRQANDFPREDVIGAAANLVINGLRQSHATRQAAEAAFDELFGRAKAALMEHYDSAGRKRGIFPYHQHVNMTHFDARKRQ